MPTLIEYAQLSARVYNRRDANRVPVPQGWNELLWLPDRYFGFSAGAYQRGNEIVSSFTGTNEAQVLDFIVANGPLAAGAPSPQLAGAVSLYHQIKETFPGASISLTGHSLGGGLSLLYALRHPEKVRGLVLVNPFYDLNQLPPVLQTMFRRRLFNSNLIELAPYRLFRFFIDMTSFNYYIGHRESHTLPEHIRYQTALDYKRASSGIYNFPRTLPSLTLELNHVHQPTLLLWGGQDQTLQPSSFPELTNWLPNLNSDFIS